MNSTANDSPTDFEQEENSQNDSANGMSIAGNVNGAALIAGNQNNVTVNNTMQINTPGLGSAPARPSLLIGRDDDLNYLKARLGIGTTSYALEPLTIVRGWPGVGKTTLIKRLAHEQDVINAFPDGILWASLGPEPEPLLQLNTWGASLKADEISQAKTLNEASLRLSAFLRTRRVLLIVDDVWEPKHATPFMVAGQACAILITTRLQSVADTLTSKADDIYLLNPLSDAEGLKLIDKLAQNVVVKNKDEALELVQKLAGLPLALQVAGRLLDKKARRGYSISNLLSELTEEAKLLELEAPADIADLAQQTNFTIAALLQKSTNRLDVQTRQCFARLGVFAPNPAYLDAAAMQAVWQVKNFDSVADALIDMGLLEYDAQRNGYQMHALLHQFGQTLLPPKELKAAQQKHFAFFQELAKKYIEIDPSQKSNPKTQQFELFYPQIKYALANFEKAYKPSVWKNVPEKLQQMIQLIDTLDRYWALHSEFADQAKWLEVAYNCAGALNIPLKQANFARWLGRVKGRQGKLEDGFKWMKRCETALGEDQSTQANAIRALMYIHRAFLGHEKGSFATAEKDCLRGLEIATETEYPKIYAEGWNIFGCIREAQDKFSTACEAFEKSLSMWQQIGDEYQIHRVGDNLHNTRWLLGDIEYVRKTGAESLHYWEQFADSTALVTALSNRGSVDYIDGKYETAIQFHQRAIEISDRIKTPYWQTLTRQNLILPYIPLEKYEEVETLLDQILEIQTKIDNPDYPVDEYRAELEIQRKNYDKAIRFAENMHELAQEEQDTLQMGIALRLLGQAHSLKNNFELAGTCLEESRKLLNKTEYKREIYLTLEMLRGHYTHIGTMQKAKAISLQAQTLAEEMGLLPKVPTH